MAEEEADRIGISPEVRECIEATSRCYTVCAETLNYSLDSNPLDEPRHIRLLIDCGDILQATQNAMLRGSELWRLLSATCMEACERAAESCRSFGRDDEQLELCAEVCDATAECCRRLAIA